MKKSILIVIILVIAGLSSPCFCADIILKENPRKTIKAKTVELTDKEIKLVYPFDEVKSVNGIAGFDRTKLNEITALGHQYVEERDYQDAVDALEKVVELDSSNAQVVTDMAVALTECKKYPEALPYVLKEIELDPNNWEAYERLGNIYRHDFKKDREKEAIAAYKKSVEIQGPTPSNQWHIGYTYQARYNKYEEALPYYEKAVTMNPGPHKVEWFFYTGLGDCYNAVGKHQEAIAVFQKVLEKYPPSESEGKAHYKAYIGQSVAYKALGQPEKALECERKAEETGFKYK